MGVGIIAMFLGGGWKVDVVSRSASTRDGLPAACGRALAAMGKPADTSGLATYATLPEAPWPTIDIVVETVTEDLALKQKLFAEMEALARPDCALTSNSSSFPISEIGKGLEDAEARMMGLHFFMPAHLIPLVEVVRSVHTDVKQAEKVGAIMALARQAAGAGQEGRDRLPGQPHPGRADARGLVADRAGRRLARGYRRHGAAQLRLPLRRRRPDRAEGAFRLGHDLRGRQDHLARPQQRRRPAADPADATSTRAASASRPSAASSRGTTSPSQKSAPVTSALFASVWRSSARKESSRRCPRQRAATPPPPPPKRRPPPLPPPPPLPRGPPNGGRSPCGRGVYGRLACGRAL